MAKVEVKSEKKIVNKQVKLTLPEDIYKLTAAEASSQGLSTATYVRTLVFQAVSEGTDRKESRQKRATNKTVQVRTRIPDLF